MGDPDKPKLVFFFDEAHLLFDDAPKALVDKVEQVARLIRSKGVGVYFITQNPADVPDEVIGQLGNRIQHALRAFTAKDRKELRMAAETYRENPAFDTEEAIREVGVGEAVTSMLQKKGVPGIVERTLIRPPSSQLGPITKAERARNRWQPRTWPENTTSPWTAKAPLKSSKPAPNKLLKKQNKPKTRPTRLENRLREFQRGPPLCRATGHRSTSRRTRGSRRASAAAMANAVIKELKGTTGRRIVRGILGGLFKGR